MQANFLPPFIREYWSKLDNDSLSLSEQAQILQVLLDEMVAFLGKLTLLEYAKNYQQKDATEDNARKKINIWLLETLQKKVSNQSWLELLQKIWSYWKINQIQPVLPLLVLGEKYPSLYQSASEDRIQKLLWFYSLVHYTFFVVSTADINEYKEQLDLLRDDFAFLANVHYEVNDGKTRLLYQNKFLGLEPFFQAKLIGSDGLQIYSTKTSNSNELIIFLQQLLPKEYNNYQQTKQGVADFSGIAQQHQRYVLLPWVELQLHEVFTEMFELPYDMTPRRVLLEGFPGTGKTALASNIPQIMQEQADHFFYYHITANSVYQSLSSLQIWLEQELKQIKITPDKKIVVILDGIENLTDSIHFILEKPEWKSLAWVLCRRLHTSNSVHASYKIELAPDDNINFNSIYTKAYVKDLLHEYVGEDLVSKNLLRFLVENFNQGYYSVAQVSQRLSVYTPCVLKSFLRMKPLLKITEYQEGDWTQLRFSLFHSVCKLLVSS